MSFIEDMIVSIKKLIKAKTDNTNDTEARLQNLCTISQTGDQNALASPYLPR